MNKMKIVEEKQKQKMEKIPKSYVKFLFDALTKKNQNFETPF
jgi:hypothetical protein